MPHSHHLRRQRQVRRRRRGNITVLTAVLLIPLLAAVAFSVDTAYMQLVRTELHIATDLAARAGTECILRTRDEFQARRAVKENARAHRVAGAALNLQDADIVFGRVVENENGPSVFEPGLKPFNACQVRGERTAVSVTGPVRLFFGPAFGVRHFEPRFTATVTRPSSKRDIVVVVDRSLSMNDLDVRGTKWNGLLTAFDGLLTTLDETSDKERVGLTSYSGGSTIDATLTTNYGRVRSALRRQIPLGSTNITSGMASGLNVLSSARNDPKVQKVMIVMTDGMHTSGPSPLTMVDDVKRANVKLIAITFGLDADQAGMRQLAKLTDSKHYHAATGRELESFLEEIGSGTDGLQYFQ